MTRKEWLNTKCTIRFIFIFFYEFPFDNIHICYHCQSSTLWMVRAYTHPHVWFTASFNIAVCIQGKWEWLTFRTQGNIHTWIMLMVLRTLSTYRRIHVRCNKSYQQKHEEDEKEENIKRNGAKEQTFRNKIQLCTNCKW